MWQADGTTGVVQVVEVVARQQRMYNLTVDVAHTFFVGDGEWLVHNCSFSPKRLQHEFSKHASDFGVTGNWNKANAEKFQTAIVDHINSAKDKILGTFRGTVNVTHYFNPDTKVWAAVDEAGEFVAGWKLSD